MPTAPVPGGHPRSVEFDSKKERMSQLQQRECSHPAFLLCVPSGPRGPDTTIAMRVNILPQISNSGASPERPHRRTQRLCLTTSVDDTKRTMIVSIYLLLSGPWGEGELRI